MYLGAFRFPKIVTVTLPGLKIIVSVNSCQYGAYINIIIYYRLMYQYNCVISRTIEARALWANLSWSNRRLESLV